MTCSTSSDCAMSGNGGSRKQIAGVGPLLFLILAVLLAPSAGAQTALIEPTNEPFPLGTEARRALARIQNDWLDWVVACNEAQDLAADAVIDDLLAHTRLLGMDHVPSLAIAAARRAADFAEAGDMQRAHCGLAAAERLDPHRPESAFAAARVARLEGRYLGALERYLAGFARGLGEPATRAVLMHNAGLWLISALALSGLLLVGMLMFSRGAQVYLDVFRYFARFVPRWACHLLTFVLLAWPILLPAGFLWIAIYWSVLFWPYGGRLERVSLIVVWLFLGTLPVLLIEQNRRLGLGLFAPVQSIEGASRGELEGDLFHHLVLLDALLPDSTALDHFRADIHRKLGQMAPARALYREVLSREADNAAALNDLGIYYFEVSDFDQAGDYFRQAAASDSGKAEVHFNLSQTSSELYKFGDSEESLRQAREIDSESVSAWLQLGQVERVVPLDGGLDRVEEVRAQLLSQWRVEEERLSWFALWRRSLSLPLVGVFIAIAIAVRFLARRGPLAKSTGVWSKSRLDRVRRALLVGAPEAEVGQVARALGALVLLMVFGTLVGLERLGYSVPWLAGPAAGLPLGIAGVGLTLVFLLRFWRDGQDRS